MRHEHAKTVLAQRFNRPAGDLPANQLNLRCFSGAVDHDFFIPARSPRVAASESCQCREQHFLPHQGKKAGGDVLPH